MSKEQKNNFFLNNFVPVTVNKYSSANLLAYTELIYILFFNRYVQSWIDTREVQSERANLTILFDKYAPVLLETLRFRFKKITPIVEINHIQMLTYLLECLLTPDNTPPDCPKELYELYFVFACVWAFGGVMFQDQVIISLLFLQF